MYELRVNFPDGFERVLIRHENEMNVAATYQKLLAVLERSLDPEERFQIGMFRDEDAQIGVVHCDVSGEVREVQWMAPDARFGRTPEKFDAMRRLRLLETSISLLHDSLRLAPTLIASIRRMIEGLEPPVPLEQGNRTIIDKLRHRYPELQDAQIYEHNFVPPESIEDLAILSVSILTGSGWKNYRLELVP